MLPILGRPVAPSPRPQQWLKASPRPQQWLLIGVQGCRLTGFKPLKCLAGRLQCFQSSPSACAVPALQPAVCLHRAQHAPLPHAQRPTSQANGIPQQAQQAPRPQAKATTRPQQWLKASPRPQQWLLIGVQGCRLTGFKPLKCLAGRLQCFQYSAGRLHQAQGHSNGSRHPPGHSNGFL